ncbi:MAG TPA: alkaline phosphatase family protein [Gemmatimonadaceae bacterium]|jgi:predicted AlkP superfamily pyrophosphatase or phosphodiesterase|nr:alkaline phosphatase family protein [Gemmatimonadaceae bacterium]
MSRSFKNIVISAALMAFPAIPACAQVPDTATPKLVLFITIDQMRPDYFTRFGSQLTGGLGRLYRGGAFFSNAFQDHAITETAPGHSETMSGRFPVHTGIQSNSAGVNDTTVTLINASGLGASPFRFRGTTLTDWLIAKDPRTKVLSVSRKDRGAILPIGRSKQPVFWYAFNGIFTTSTYYSATLPDWVTAFNARRLPASYAGQSWRLLLPDSAYPEPDSVPVESGGVRFQFPYLAPSAPDSAAAALPGFPWMDDVTLQFALAGVNALNLGAGPQTDVLSISLSTTDAIGHRFGPDSRELHDHILRLDRYLGTFLDSLFRIRKQRDVVIALTADHGVTPYPEIHTHDPNTGAMRVDVQPVLQRLNNSLAARGVPSAGAASAGMMGGNGFSFEDGVLVLDHAALAKAKINEDSLLRAVKADFLHVPGVARADRISELARGDTVQDNVARRWLHMYADDSQVAMVISLAPYNYWTSSFNIAWHGSPNDPDAHVPILFYGNRIKPGRYPEFARVVDMAPTLAALVRVTPQEKLDGHVLQNAIR